MSIKEPIYTPDDKLEEALAQLAGGISLEAILNEAGDDAEWLRPMLEITAQVSDLQQNIPIPPPDASLQRLLSYAQELAAAPQSDTTPSPARKQKLSQLFNTGRRVRFAVGLIAAALLIALLGGGLNSVAQDSLPGQPLYRIKQAGEALQLSLAQNSEQRERLTQIFNQRRQAEVKQLLERGMQAEIEFTSSVEAVTATEITVNGLKTQIASDTEIVGALAVDAQVQVQGITQPPDAIKAFVITVLEPAPDKTAPSPTSLNTAIPTLTQTPSPQPQATSLPLITAPTETAAPPLPSPPPVPTQLPIVDEDSANDNDNSNENPPDELDDANNDDSSLTTATDDGNTNEDDFIDDVDDGNVDDFDEEFDDTDNSSGGGDSGNSGSNNSGSGNSGDNGGGDNNSGPGHGDDNHDDHSESEEEDD